MNGEVLIVDEHTGRILAGRRYNEGMHQAIEAKEGVEIKAGEPDPRHHHPAELLPPLRQALRHDRHGHDRGRRVQPDLQARRRADPDEHADDPRRPGRPRLQDRGRQVHGGRRRHRRAAREGPAGPGRHRQRREVRAPLVAAAASAASRTRSSTPSTTSARPRSSPQAGRKGAVTVATNMAGRGTDIMLGGNAEFLADHELRSTGLSPGRDARGVRGGLARGRSSRSRSAVAAEHDEVVEARRPLRPGHRAPRVAAHRQPAARPLRPPGRPGRVPVLPLARRRPDAAVQGATMVEHVPDPVQRPRRRADRVEDGHQRHPVGADPGRGAELRDPQERPQVRRGPQPPAHWSSTTSAAGCSRARTCTSRSGT